MTNAEIAKLKAAAAGRTQADPPTMKDYLDSLNVDSETMAAQEKKAEKKRKERQQALGKFGKKLMGDPVPDRPGYYVCLDCATGRHGTSKTFLGGTCSNCGGKEIVSSKCYLQLRAEREEQLRAGKPSVFKDAKDSVSACPDADPKLPENKKARTDAHPSGKDTAGGSWGRRQW